MFYVYWIAFALGLSSPNEFMLNRSGLHNVPVNYNESGREIIFHLNRNIDQTKRPRLSKIYTLPYFAPELYAYTFQLPDKMETFKDIFSLFKNIVYTPVIWYYQPRVVQDSGL